MVRITLFCALCLIATGIFGFSYSGAVTALIPAFLGIIIGICGLIATKKKLHMHAMHGATLTGLLAVLGTAGSIPKLFTIWAGGDVDRPLAVYMQTLTLAIGTVYLILAVRSFLNARRQRVNTNADHD